MTERKSFTKACMDFFGKLPGQSTQEFAVEIRKVKANPVDYDYFVAEFAKIGVEVTSDVRVI